MRTIVVLFAASAMFLYSAMYCLYLIAAYSLDETEFNMIKWLYVIKFGLAVTYTTCAVTLSGKTK